MRSPPSALAHLWGTAVLGLVFFALPIPVGGQWTVLFDVVVRELRMALGELVGLYCVVLMGWGVKRSLFRRDDYGLEPPLEGTGRVLPLLRIAGFVLAIFQAGLLPTFLLPAFPVLVLDSTRGLMWNTLTFSVGLIIPLGAVVLRLMVSYGFLEGLGTMMRPIMRPLFLLPGRAALDDLMSWLGSYSVGLYMTQHLVLTGKYTRREAFIIVTGFSTVSIGFVGIVASTLRLLHLFPLIFGTYFVVVYLLAALQARIWPASFTADTYVRDADPEPELSLDELFDEALKRAQQRAADAPPLWREAWFGLREGLTLAASVLGTILAVGTFAVVLAEHTPVFEILGTPLVPVLAALGLPDPEILAPATLAGITEMYIPAILVTDASEAGRFFIGVLSISQLVFFSSVGPMMLEMFREVPIRLHHLLFLFVLRTALLIPVLAGWTAVLVWMGVLS